MKKFIISCQIVIVVFFAVKILFLTAALRINSIPFVFSLNNFGKAIAQTNSSGANALSNSTSPAVSTRSIHDVKDVTDDPLKKERELFASLQKKQKDLEIRENALKAEEEKILALRQEITQKIDTLKALETRLASRLDTDRENDAKRLRDLAKVYEAAPPQKAAAMLEQLDVNTAAQLSINMKRDRAGLIWGYITPKKAVAITNEITRTASMATE